MTATEQRTDRRSRRKLPWPLEFYRADVGKKWAMALSGIVLLGYVLVHMLGNLKVYFGPESINAYGEGLRDLGEPLVPHTHLLWIMRVGLALAFAVHVHAAYTLTYRNHQARGRPRYEASRRYLAADYASRTMRWGGTIVLLFVVFHLADLTWGNANPDFVRGDPYSNMIASFERLPVAALYIVANLALAPHIYHGAWSMFQSMGVNNPRFNTWRRVFATGLAGVILVGNLSIPIAVQLGIIA